MTTKSELLKSGETLETEVGSTTAYASENPKEWDGQEVIGGGYGISYHQGRMPAHGTENFPDLEQLIEKMKSIAPLRNWRISKPD